MTEVEWLIVGSGFTGAAALYHLLEKNLALEKPRHSSFAIAGDCKLGLGVAYGKAGPNHLLNVPAAKMSLTSLEPDQFFDWISRQEPSCNKSDFRPRRQYGEYVNAYVLNKINEARSQGLKVGHFEERVSTLSRSSSKSKIRWVTKLASGIEIGAHDVILATGWMAPKLPTSLSALSPLTTRPDLLSVSPWDYALKARNGQRVLVIGTGLTGIDLTLDGLAHGCQVTMLSRHGLLPRLHFPDPLYEFPKVVGTDLTPGDSVRVALKKLKQACRRAEEENLSWTAVMDSIRQLTTPIWQQWSSREKQLFLRHVFRYWEIHRHRVPVASNAKLKAAQNTGQLRIVAGKIRQVEILPDGCVEIAIAGKSDVKHFKFDHIINATNATGLDLNVNELLADLSREGHIVSDDLGLGLAIDGAYRCLSRSSQPSPGLYALGPLCRGSLWEITSVPEIRIQIEKFVEGQ